MRKQKTAVVDNTVATANQYHQPLSQFAQQQHTPHLNKCYNPRCECHAVGDAHMGNTSHSHFSTVEVQAVVLSATTSTAPGQIAWDGISMAAFACFCNGVGYSPLTSSNANPLLDAYHLCRLLLVLLFAVPLDEQT